ncbi:MAG: Tex family protein [Eubacteriales bacterium]|nr:Tex family protein [Eubacteriales bacterium]
MDISRIITKELGIREAQTEAVIKLYDEGNTIPFIARYRKEQTGGLDDDVLRAFEERLKYLRNLQDRKDTVLASIEEQGKLTDELKAKIDEAMTAVEVEDLYRPYRPKRKTRASVAEAKGLRPLAEYILSDGADHSVEEEAGKYVDPEKEVESAEAAIQYAEDIIAGDLSDDADTRAWIRKETEDHGILVTSGKNEDDDPKKQVYEMYFDRREPVRAVPGHRVLAVNRGEAEKVLSVKIELAEEPITQRLAKEAGAGRNQFTDKYIREAAEDAYKRLIAPSIEKEVRGELTDKAQEGAIKVFADNLKQLLMQPPLAGKTVLGWDPGYRNGCKLAVCDETGKILDTTVVYPTEPYNRVDQAKRVFMNWVRKYHVDVISIGNGTASRESEKIVADFIRESGLDLYYVITNEAGASVYSASKLAAEELPDLDVEGRSSASIARRVQDPLAELVKIDPRSIGVGQYQHDMDQKKLGEALGTVVEDAVNHVGVDLNTASAPLLQYVSGVSKPVANNIVKYREENGRFKSRRELLKVSRLGPKAYEQCAGFLRIRGGEEPLDMTAVHPESYEAARNVLRFLGVTEADLISGAARDAAKNVLTADTKAQLKELAESAGTDTYTLTDILKEVEKPGRDPREDVQAPILRSDVMDMNDLKPGMKLKGTVRNIVDFGAFVDIGVHQDGLVHISEMSNRRINHPLDLVKVGDIVDVTVLSVDEKRGRISLSMKNGEPKEQSGRSADSRRDSRKSGGSGKRQSRSDDRREARDMTAMERAFAEAKRRKNAKK